MVKILGYKHITSGCNTKIGAKEESHDILFWNHVSGIFAASYESARKHQTPLKREHQRQGQVMDAPDMFLQHLSSKSNIVSQSNSLLASLTKKCGHPCENCQGVLTMNTKHSLQSTQRHQISRFQYPSSIQDAAMLQPHSDMVAYKMPQCYKADSHMRTSTHDHKHRYNNPRTVPRIK
ncbi:hypothetical protein ACOSQ4_015915 [Xanthoceras sorbifolium]